MARAALAAGSPAATRWPVVGLLVVTGMIAAAHLFKLPPALPLIRHELGLSLVAGGWLISIANVLAMVCGVGVGLVADRFGYRRVLIAGLAAFTVAALGGSAATSPALLFLARFLEGFGFLAVTVAAPSLIVRETAARDQPIALTFWSIYNPAGGALILFGAPFVLAASGWRVLWLELAILTALILAVVVSVRLHPTPSPAGATIAPPPAMLANLKDTLRRAGPWLVAAAFAVYTLQYAALMTWLPSVLIEDRGLDVTTAGALTAIAMAVNIIGNLSAGLLLRRGVRHGALIVATAVLMALAAGVIFSALPDFVRYLGCVALSLFGGMLPGAVLASAPLVAPSRLQLGTVNGLIVQGSNCGLVAGPPLAALIVTATGRWEALLGLFLAANLIAAMLGLALLRRTHPSSGAFH